MVLCGQRGHANYAFLTAERPNMLTSCGSPEQVDRLGPPMVDGPLLRDDVSVGAQSGKLRAAISPVRAEPRQTEKAPAVRNKNVDQAAVSMSSRRTSCISCWRGFPMHQRASGASACSSFTIRARGADESADRTTSWLAGLNHKLGQRGTVNAVLSSGRESIFS